MNLGIIKNYSLSAACLFRHAPQVFPKHQLYIQVATFAKHLGFKLQPSCFIEDLLTDSNFTRGCEGN